MSYQNDPYGNPTQYPPQFQQYAPPRQNGLALASMIVSICALVLCGGLFGIAGAIMGHIAKKQIKQTHESGDGFALAGIIVGWIGFGIFLLVVAFYFIVFVLIATNGGFDSPSPGSDFD